MSWRCPDCDVDNSAVLHGDKCPGCEGTERECPKCGEPMSTRSFQCPNCEGRGFGSPAIQRAVVLFIAAVFVLVAVIGTGVYKRLPIQYFYPLFEETYSQPADGPGMPVGPASAAEDEAAEEGSD